MRNQIQMLGFLNQIVSSHSIASKGNKITAKKLINHRSFTNFTLTYLKTNEVSIKVGSYTKRLACEDSLVQLLGEFTAIDEATYKAAGKRLDEEWELSRIAQ